MERISQESADVPSDRGRVFAIRHGESFHNVAKDSGQPAQEWQAIADPGLTPRGEMDANMCQLDKLNDPIIISSPLRRTLATATTLRRIYGGSVVAHPSLQEVHNTDRSTGKHRACDRGTKLSELRTLPCATGVDFSMCTESWMNDARIVVERIRDVFGWIAQNVRPTQDVILVTHNGVLRRAFGWADAPHCQAIVVPRKTTRIRLL